MAITKTEQPTNATAPEKLCTKCNERPKSGGAEDTNPWCKECRNEYQRDYRDGQSWRDERRGIVRGIKAFREGAAAEFKGYSNRHFSGAEVAFMLEQMTGPAVMPEDAKVATPPPAAPR